MGERVKLLSQGLSVRTSICMCKNKDTGGGCQFCGKSSLSKPALTWMDGRSLLDYVCISGILSASGTIRFSPLPSRSGLLYPLLPRSRLEV